MPRCGREWWCVEVTCGKRGIRRSDSHVGGEVTWEEVGDMREEVGGGVMAEEVGGG